MKLSEIETPLRPPATYSDAEVKLAKLRFVIETYEEKLSGIMYGKYDHAEIIYRIENLRSDIDLEDDESINSYAVRHNWGHYVGSINDVHDGDCTGRAYLCNRCRIERYLGVSTAPPSKAVGSKMLIEYSYKIVVVRQQRILKGGQYYEIEK